MTLGWNNPTTQPTMTVLLRHGDTRMSPEHRFSGLCDLPLSADGSRQARAAACRLAAGARSTPLSPHRCGVLPPPLPSRPLNWV